MSYSAPCNVKVNLSDWQWQTVNFLCRLKNFTWQHLRTFWLTDTKSHSGWNFMHSSKLSKFTWYIGNTFQSNRRNVIFCKIAEYLVMRECITVVVFQQFEAGNSKTVFHLGLKTLGLFLAWGPWLVQQRTTIVSWSIACRKLRNVWCWSSPRWHNFATKKMVRTPCQHKYLKTFLIKIWSETNRVETDEIGAPGFERGKCVRIGKEGGRNSSHHVCEDFREFNSQMPLPLHSVHSSWRRYRCHWRASSYIPSSSLRVVSPAYHK